MAFERVAIVDVDGEGDFVTRLRVGFEFSTRNNIPYDLKITDILDIDNHRSLLPSELSVKNMQQVMASCLTVTEDSFEVYDDSSI